MPLSSRRPSAVLRRAVIVGLIIVYIAIHLIVSHCLGIVVVNCPSSPTTALARARYAAATSAAAAAAVAASSAAPVGVVPGRLRRPAAAA